MRQINIKMPDDVEEIVEIERRKLQLENKVVFSISATVFSIVRKYAELTNKARMSLGIKEGK